MVLALVLALDAADKGTVGAVAAPLKQDLSLSDTQIGLLVAVLSLLGGAATFPAGMLVDRVRRTRLLAGSITLWALAMVTSALSGSFLWLLLSRLGLGLVTATAGPSAASLIGDYVPGGKRGRVYGLLLTGELSGTGAGLVGAGLIAGLLSWRWSFGLLALPALPLAWLVWRLPEPERGGQVQADSSAGAGKPTDPDGEGGRHADEPQGQAASGPHDPSVRQAVEEAKIQPRSSAILRQDPSRLPLWSAVRYVLAVRTNLLLIVASSVGYFFFGGLRTFAIVFVRQHYSVGQATASLLALVLGVGAVSGVLTGGRLSDRLLRQGHVSARVAVAAIAYIAAAVILGPAIWSSVLAISLPLYVVAAGALAAPNPPLDAARLDVIHHGLWGRAEAVRTLARTLAEGAGPLTFGLLADHVFHGGSGGLELTFLLMLLPLMANGLVLLPALRTYPRDVTSALESERRTLGDRLRRGQCS
ncbi:MAG TPA: MFS transporter [Actinomycetota bacterium]|jgi:MFS family permease|nr:MFS transporter [Actinomycetota bacterium]